MPTRITRHSASADFEVTPDGVLLVTWRGLVALNAAEEVKEAICSGLAVKPVGVVSDYRGAVVAMGDAQLVHIMMGGQHDLPDLPAAVVANEHISRALRRAAITAAWVAGRWRHVCHDPREALGWNRAAQAQPDLVSRSACRVGY